MLLPAIFEFLKMIFSYLQDVVRLGTQIAESINDRNKVFLPQFT